MVSNIEEESALMFGNPIEHQLPNFPRDGLHLKFREALDNKEDSGWIKAFPKSHILGGRVPPLEIGFGSPPKVVYYSPSENVGGIGGYEYLPAPPDMGSGQDAGTWGMQGGLVILMFGVCYMLYMLLKKRVCSFSIGWKDTDGGELELGGPRDA